jgi:hypothetical protein
VRLVERALAAATPCSPLLSPSLTKENAHGTA